MIIWIVLEFGIRCFFTPVKHTLSGRILQFKYYIEFTYLFDIKRIIQSREIIPELRSCLHSLLLQSLRSCAVPVLLPFFLFLLLSLFHSLLSVLLCWLRCVRWSRYHTHIYRAESHDFSRKENLRSFFFNFFFFA